MRKTMMDLLNEFDTAREPVVLGLNTTLEDAHRILGKSGQRSIPIVDGDGKICALFDKEHLAEAILENQKHQLAQLHDYINGYSVLGVSAQLQY